MKAPPLFAFGTLMDADVLAVVCDVPRGTFATEPARVRDRVRRAVRDEHYPVLVAAPDGLVEGLLIHGLDEAALERIAFFEGEEFELAPITVERAAADGKGGAERQSPETVDARHFAQTGRVPIDETPWELADWQRYDKPDTLRRIRHYMGFYGRLSVAEADAEW